MTKIGRLIRACRADASREKWAGELGVHPNTLKMYESGDRLPELDFLIKLSDIHGIPFPSLLIKRMEDSPEEGAERAKNELGPFIGMSYESGDRAFQETMRAHMEGRTLEPGIPVPLFGLVPAEENHNWYQCSRAARSSVEAPFDVKDLEPFGILVPEPSPISGFVCICSAERTVVAGGLVYIERQDGLCTVRYCDRRTADEIETSFWSDGHDLVLLSEVIPATDVAKIAPVLWIKTRL